jgi:parvulin-like peptidyl-prolyl isomerase
MPARKKDRSTRRGWRRFAFLIGCLALLAGGGYWIRSSLLPPAEAQTPIPPTQPAGGTSATPVQGSGGNNTATAGASPGLAPEVPSDYSRRVVAYVYDNEPITREELGDYLIERHADKLELLVNKRIIDDACRRYNVEVTGAEIESALAEQLQGWAIDRKTFVNTLLARYHKNLYEWKEDVIHSRLQLTKLCRSRVQVSDEELHKAFESAYGEKVECQIILWPKGEKGKAEALAAYADIRDSAKAFDRQAKNQKVKPELAATAGKVRAFGRHVIGDDNFDRIVFALKEKEISEVFETIDGVVVVKCLRHLPADASVHFESVRDKLNKEMVEKKIVAEMQTAFDKLKRQAAPQTFLKKKTKAEDPDGLTPCDPRQRYRQIVAVYNGQTPITREEFGEFLISRYGTEQVEFLVNRRLIARACQARGITVTPQEIEASLADDLKKLDGIDVKVFEREFLKDHSMSIYQWREDVIRPRLLMAKLWSDGVKVSDDDLRGAFEAEYGEKLEGRMILWPSEQAKYALMQYTNIRDNPAAFDEASKHQISTTLAAKGGKIGPFGRGTLGNKDVEDEAFKLHPGEMTSLIETPEGNVVFKLDKRHPANTTVKLDSVRDALMHKVFERKLQMQMQTAFKELRDQAHPRVMLKDEQKPVDIVESTKELLKKSADPLNLPAPR